MSKVYDWIERNPQAARVWALIIPLVVIASLSVPAFLFIPGLIDNLNVLHKQSPARFYGFVVAPAAISVSCALIWGLGDIWERMGIALFSGYDSQGADD